jgi:hypothetical protein
MASRPASALTSGPSIVSRTVGRRSGSASGDVHAVVDHLGTRFQLHDPFQADGGAWIPPHFYFSESTASGK